MLPSKTRDHQATLERLCRDELALAGAKLDHLETYAIVVAEAVVNDDSASIAEVIEQFQRTNTNWFRQPREARR